MKNDKKGFLLAELQVAAAVLALLTAVLYTDLRQLITGWNKMLLDAELDDAARYSLNVLQKEISYESRLVELDKTVSGQDRIICRQNAAGRTLAFTSEKNMLYKTTQTTETKGKNPVSLPDIALSSWRAVKVADDVVSVSFTLAKNGRKRSFCRQIKTFNGEVRASEQ